MPSQALFKLEIAEAVLSSIQGETRASQAFSFVNGNKQLRSDRGVDPETSDPISRHLTSGGVGLGRQRPRFVHIPPRCANGILMVSMVE